MKATYALDIDYLKTKVQFEKKGKWRNININLCILKDTCHLCSYANNVQTIQQICTN